MNLKKLASLGLALLFLAGCGNRASESSSSAPAAATILNGLSDSIYGSLTWDEGVDLENLHDGDSVGFTIAAEEDYSIGTVTMNGTTLTGDANNHYTATLQRGTNRLTASFDIDATVDFVEKFKLNVDDTTFFNLMNRTQLFDFRRDGVEQGRTENESGFVNYVDGDTTHMETYNYGYTVKIRYLSIDTPESTSELEEWGKSASLFNQSCLKSATKVILQSQGRAIYPNSTDSSVWTSTTDANGRNLAYVWYATEASPTLDDFRCLNLEMVYNGYSYGTGSISDSGLEYYKVFEKARRSAEANKRGMFSDEADPNYYYGEPVEKTLKEIYQGCATDEDGFITGGTDSQFNDEKTLYALEGYVSRKIGGAFYFQDKYDYEQVGTEKVEAYGMYVFTYAQTAIQVGQKVRVIGVISEYGGNLQMMGISWKTLNPNPKRDTMIIDETIHEIVPVKIASSAVSTNVREPGAYYNHVLVELVDDLYGLARRSSTRVSGVYNDYGEGGTHCVNKYNTRYPFYNDSNKVIFAAALGNSAASANNNNFVRITTDQDLILSYGSETCHSYKFFTGGTDYYYPGDASKVAYSAGIMNYSDGSNEFAAFEEDWNAVQDDSALIKEDYTRKQFHMTAICQYYTSSSGATTRWSFNIVSAGDVTITGTLPLQNN